MGNCFRRFLGEDSHSEYAGHGYGRPEAGGAGPIGHAGVGFTALAQDLFEFETTNKVPELLGYYISASKATQRIWYAKLLVAWKRANPAPASPEAAAVLVVQTLQDYHGIEYLLRYYYLPWPTVPFVQPVPEVTEPETIGTWLVEPASDEIQLEIRTLPVDWAENVGDGDGITVYEEVGEDARDESKEIKDLRKKIQHGLYKWVIEGKNGQDSCIAHKYKIRLRGVDAPEIGQHFGDEARDILRNLVKDQRLVIHVYDADRYRRAVGDVYCRGTLIQEELLRKGSVWHYKRHDKRPKFAELERVAKAARLGLWAHPNPQEPWNWRKGPKNLGRKGKSFGKKRGA